MRHNFRCIQDDAIHFLTHSRDGFDLIVCDLHGNSPEDWQKLSRPLLSRLNPGGTLLIDNLNLAQIPEWKAETGVRWFLSQLPPGWKVETYEGELPGVAKVTSL